MPALSLPSLLPALQPETAFPDDPAFLESLFRPRLSLLWGTQAPTRTLLTAATALVAGGTPVRLFDGGNAFDGYFAARLARPPSVLPSFPEALMLPWIRAPRGETDPMKPSAACACRAPSPVSSWRSSSRTPPPPP